MEVVFNQNGTTLQEHRIELRDISLTLEAANPPQYHQRNPHQK